MKIGDIAQILNCQPLSRDFSETMEIEKIYASDLMSDILVAPNPGALLLSGLVNNQVIRTSKIARIGAIVFVRNKKPSPETIRLSDEYQIPLFSTELSMFDACGILFAQGLKSALTRNKKQ
jgi:hypothetical protein